ncbi:vomeronasal type-1 receptor 1-like [Mustela lutreola]|uniref:vomeronasal type-1 receptor 1-like n=1 Tax=Mustela lutreola TaxID=9666 RepID=UPI002796F799|nr:vomeronasal type-1 receptor 1-like [Mustela lutreola]
MISSDIIFGIFFIFQTCIGFMGNSLLFTLYMYIFLILPHKKKPLDMILAHLTLANALTLIFRGIPIIMSSFGIRLEMGNAGCKIVLYIQRVTRSISLCTTALQSMFQAVTITPSNHKWAWLKHRIFIFIQPSLLFFWMINMAIYSVVILQTEANTNATVDGLGYYSPYCKYNAYGLHIAPVFLSTIFIRDSFFLSLMTCNSIYMVNILYRHHKTAQNVRNTIQSSSPSPENKATYVILILVSCFVFFYWTNTFLTIYAFYTSKKKQQLEKFSNFFSSSYPTICSLFLVKNENRIYTRNFMQARIRISSS